MFFRFLLLGLLIYLIVSMVNRFLSGGSEKKKGPDIREDTKGKRGVPKDMGEYVDYEEVDDD